MKPLPIRALALSIMALLSLLPAARAQGLSSSKMSLAGQRTLWLGDSITAAGDYVTFVEYLLEKQFPTQKFDIISIGLASETTSGLSEKAHPFPRPDVHERLPRALALVKPTLVVACYGMNDGIYHPQSPERLQAFQKGILTVAAAVKAAGARLILLTPPPFDPVNLKNLQGADAPDFSYMSPYKDYDSVLADYARWEMSLASSDLLPIDLHTPINAYLQAQRQANPHFSFVQDGIHPNAAGHLLMAEIILRRLGVPVPPENLDAELAKIQADPLYALIQKQRNDRSSNWLDYVGYTRGQTVKTNSIDRAEQDNAHVQAQIDQMRTHAD